MKKHFFFTLLFLPAILNAQLPDSSSALFAMRNAENSFSMSSAANGRRDAFAEFLAERSVIFTSKWITNGKEFWTGRPPSPVILKWEPEFMDISDGRDFGYSTGPYEAQEFRPNTDPVLRGYFLSVWEKQADGNWKVILDAGTTSPAPAKPHAFSFPAGDDKNFVTNVTKSDSGPEAAETEMLSAWKKSPDVKTYMSFCSKELRMMRDGRLPSVNGDTINKWISGLTRTISWKTDGSKVSGTGDMGFTYGYLADPSGHYVRIWKRDSGGAWKVIAEIMNF